MSLPNDRNWYIVSPKHRWMASWDKAMIVALLFTAIITPFEVAFVPTTLGNTMWWINRLVDMYFLSDIVLNFCMAFFDTNESQVLYLVQHFIYVTIVMTLLFLNIILYDTHHRLFHDAPP